MLTFHEPAAPPDQVRGAVVVAALGLALTILALSPPVARTLGWARPDWALAASVYLAWRTRLWLAASAAFALGFFQDALRMAPEGLAPLALIAVVATVSRLASWMRLGGYSRLALTLAVAAMLKDLVVTPCLMGVMGFGWTALTGRPVIALVAAALVTGLVGPLAFAGLDRLLAVLEKKRD